MRLHIKIDDENEVHTKITIFIDGANCGQLCLSSGDWPVVKNVLSEGTMLIPTVSLQVSKLEPVETGGEK